MDLLALRYGGTVMPDGIGGYLCTVSTCEYKVHTVDRVGLSLHVSAKAIPL